LKNTSSSSNSGFFNNRNNILIAAGVAVALGLICIIALVVFWRRRSQRAHPDPRGKSYLKSSMPDEYNNGPMSQYNGDSHPISILDDPNAAAETMEVVYNYVPQLSDEIHLYVGDPIIVKAKFDDGWALGYNMATKEEGSFPLACVQPYAGDKVGDYESSRGGNSRYQSQFTADSREYGQRQSSLFLSKE